MRVARRELDATEVGGREALVDAPAQRALHHRGLLVDLLVHEVRVAVELHRGATAAESGDRLGVRGLVAVGADDRELPVVEMHDLIGVAHHRLGVGRHEHLVLADAEQHRTAVAGDDDAIGLP
jgi:hypothetical protein